MNTHDDSLIDDTTTIMNLSIGGYLIHVSINNVIATIINGTRNIDATFHRGTQKPAVI